jgi:protein TonB
MYYLKAAPKVKWHPHPSELFELSMVFSEPLGGLRLQRTPKRILDRWECLLLGAFVLVLHGAVIYWLSQAPAQVLPVVPPEILPMTIEFSQPAPPAVDTLPPPKPVAPPVVEPLPLIEDPVAIKPPEPKSKPKLAIKKEMPKPVVKKETPKLAVSPAAPPQPVAAPARPSPASPKPVTPASATAGYLRNPAPEYPALAMRRNWEGTVLLRVRVLANGKPSEIQVQTSSGRTQLDDAALAAVKRWSFVPAKQGDDPIDGWVSVPIDFKLR